MFQRIQDNVNTNSIESATLGGFGNDKESTAAQRADAAVVGGFKYMITTVCDGVTSSWNYLTNDYFKNGGYIDHVALNKKAGNIK